MYRIGIDLSKNSTGVTMIGDGMLNEIVAHRTISLIGDCETNNWYGKISLFLHQLAYEFNLKHKYCLFVIETSNFGNFKTSLLFNFLCGLWVAAIHETFNSKKIIITNSNQHQMLCGCLPSDKREVRKLKVREYFKSKAPTLDWSKWNSDEIDALSLAYWAEHLHSTQEQAEHTKQAKIAKKNEIKQKNAMLRKQNALLNKINALDKIRNKKQIERLTRELEELKNGDSNR